MKFLRWVIKFLPTFFSALILAMFIWFSAVTSNDPNVDIQLPNPVNLSIIGKSPDMVITNNIPEQVNLSIKAPQSIHARLSNESDLISVTLNLAGLEPGEHEITPQVDIAVKPAVVTKLSPEKIKVVLENLVSEKFEVILNEIGSLPISFEVGEPILSHETIEITGAKSYVQEVDRVIATVDLTNVTTNINKIVELRPLNSAGGIVENITLSPNSIQVKIPVTQLGGYRNVFVKIITSGQIANGFYLTNLFANPPNITIYTSDPVLARNMPDFIETNPINLNGADENFEIPIPLNLPEGISIIGEPTVTVQVGIAAIESSKNFSNVLIQIINQNPNTDVTLSDEVVEVYISGPLYLLDELNFSDIIVVLDLENRGPGTYQLAPKVEMIYEEIVVDAIIPGIIEVTITQ